MRRTAGPTPPPGSHGSAAPATPHRVAVKDPTRITQIIRSLENTWHLGLQVRDVYYSPSSGSNTAADKVYGRIKVCYHKDYPRLERILQAFDLVAPDTPPNERLDVLNRLLPVPAATPNSSMRKVLPQSPRNPPASSFRSQLSGQVPQSSQHGDAQGGEPESLYTTAPESDSSTDNNEEDDDMPPSPTTSSKAAQRRIQASPRLSFGSAGRKRLSDGSDHKVSSKLSKISKGKQPYTQDSNHFEFQDGQHNHLFKKPSLGALRSYQFASVNPSINHSLNTSFNTDSTAMSSQQSASQPQTANTSFTSDIGDIDPLLPKLTRESSTTMGSFDDEDLAAISVQWEREKLEQMEREDLQSSGNVAKEHFQSSGNMTRESSSTFGSIDEEALVETYYKVETDEHGRSRVDISSMRQLPRFGVAESSTFQVFDSGTAASPAKSVLKSHSTNSEASATRRIIRACGQKTGKAIINPAFDSPSSLIESLPVKPTIQPHNPREEALPSKPAPESLQAMMKNQSPIKMSHHISRLPQQNLFVEDITDDLKRLPYFILFICCRIADECNTSIRELNKNIGQDWSDSDKFWQSILAQCPQARNREPKSIWSAQKRAFDGYTFKGQVVIDKRRKEPVFKLKLSPLAPDLSCRFQRRFGADRFLFLGFPSFDADKQPKPARFSQVDMKNIQDRWTEWFGREHLFLGRKWTAFHIEPIRKKGGLKEIASDKRVILFATEGCGIDEPMSIGDMMNWFFPFAINKEQSFCKAFARLDLGLSRTTPTLAFKPSQIEYVLDEIADGCPESTRYNDHSLSWNEHYNKNEVMNDGCSLMSVGAAHEIWKRYKKVVDTSDPMPSAFQGRIGGAKGMWMVSAESYSKDPDHRRIWIKITQSQKKFEPHPEDLSDDKTYDKKRLTFEVCSYSSQPRTSDLHISFIPIIEDRGVPKEVIEKLAIERLDLERAQLLKMLPDPVKMYDWVFKQNSTSPNSEEIRWQAALPHSLPDKIKFLIENGFDPINAPYLAKILHRFIKQEQIWMEQKLRIPLGKTSMLYGVADPLGILAPGEVHVQFSRPFIDDMTDEHFRYLDDIDILVTRQPACRRSDIQKVRATTRPELAHLVDVVVFPTRGQYPLAGRLQGGDYDGDTFWLCWESSLVEPFENAPAPIHALDPLRYGIKKDKRKLHEVMDPKRLKTVDGLLREIMAFRTNPCLLGKVTIFLEKQAYRENRIYSDNLTALYDMHDLLVDAPKQAYAFSEQNWKDFIKYNLRCGNPTLPAYKAAMEACEKTKEMGEVDHLRTKLWRINENNIIDHLYFNIIRKHDVETLKMVTDTFHKDTDDDPALQYPCLAVQELNNPVMAQELKSLAVGLENVLRKWNSGMNSDGPDDSTSGNYNRTVDECYKHYRMLMPTQTEDLEMGFWVRPFLSETFSMWETLRASVLYKTYPKKIPFVWHMAGKELAELKVKSVSGSRSVCWPVHKILRPKLLKIPRRFEGDDRDEEFHPAIDEEAANG